MQSRRASIVKKAKSRMPCYTKTDMYAQQDAPRCSKIHSKMHILLPYILLYTQKWVILSLPRPPIANVYRGVQTAEPPSRSGNVEGDSPSRCRVVVHVVKVVCMVRRLGQP